MKCPMRNCPSMQRLRKDAATSTDALAVKLARDTASYTRAEDLGPSVFCTIRDCLGLDPKYKPHRNVDAVRLAKLMSQVIKEKLCKRALNGEGRLCWRFIDDAAYDSAIETLRNEQGAHNECRFLMSDPPNPGQ